MRTRLYAALVAATIVLTGCAPGGLSVTRETQAGSPDAPLLVAVGNSFVGGSVMDSGAASRWPALVADAVGADLVVISAGASGYLEPGEDGLTYADLAAEVPSDASVVVVMGSDDDDGYAEADIRAAAVATLEDIAARAPQAAIIVVSTPWVEAAPREGILVTRDAVRAAAADVGAIFVDSLGEGWLVTGPSGQIGIDGLHPTDIGHAEIADDLIPVIEQALAGR